MTAATATRSHRSELAVLTGAKVISNTALRWVGPFLPTLERAFSTTTGTLTGIMGVAELGGLTTLFTGPLLDRGNERRLFTLGLVAVGVSSLVALGGSVITFAIAFALLVIGVTNLTVAGHAWIGHRVAFSARGRAIGVFETSWAIALLVGAPVLAVLISWFGWRGPFVALAIGSFASAIAVHTLVGTGRSVHTSGGVSIDRRMPTSAWSPLLASALTAAAGLSVFVISGAWLDDAHGVSTGGLGVVAAAFGAVEFASSSSVAAVGDRIGSRRSLSIGLLVLVAGLLVMSVADDARWIAIAGLLVFLTGFEFGFVSSLTLVTEAAPLARGRAIGISNALGTVARGGGVLVSGQLYEAYGVGGSIALSAAAAATAFVLTMLTATQPSSSS